MRKLTSPYGEQFDNYMPDKVQEFKKWKNEIEEKFIMPMLKEIYPIGLTISELRMEMYVDGNSILRQMGTCPIRVIIKNKELKLDEFYKIKVVGYIGNRTLMGEIL